MFWLCANTIFEKTKKLYWVRRVYYYPPRLRKRFSDIDFQITWPTNTVYKKIFKYLNTPYQIWLISNYRSWNGPSDRDQWE